MIYLISFINFLLGFSTGIGMTIIPLLAVGDLGISFALLAFIESGSELCSASFKMLSGNLFDRFEKKRHLFTAPTCLSFFAKAILLFPTPLTLFISKITERMANGLFASPRDAFVGSTGSIFHFSLMTAAKCLGCVLGPILVAYSEKFLGKLANNLWYFIYLSTFASFLAFFLTFFLKTDHVQIKKEKVVFKAKAILSLAKHAKIPLAIIFIFFLGRFNDSTLIFFLKQQGFPPELYKGTIGYFNIAMFVASPILAILINKGQLYVCFLITLLSMIGFSLCFCCINFLPKTLAWGAIIFWGIERVGSQIAFQKLLFNLAPKNLSGTMMGIYGMLTGIGTLLSSILCGQLQEHYSFEHMFVFTGFCALVSLFLTVVYRKKLFYEK